MNPLKKLKNRFWIDAPTQRYIDFSRHKWKRDPSERKDSVILIDLFDQKTLLHCFAHTGNYLARKTNSCLRSFIFARGFADRFGLPHRRLESIYESFGAKLDLTFKGERKYREAALAWAEDTYSRLHSKWDVLNLHLDGLKIGSLVYDSYLRKGLPTVDLADPYVKELLYDAYVAYHLSKDYLDTHDVKAILTGHIWYISHGMLTHLAIARGIPVFFFMNPHNMRIVEIFNDTFDHLRYVDYKHLFAEFDEELKPKLRAEARKTLEGRLQGKIDGGISHMQEGTRSFSGYGAHQGNTLLKDTGRPRILILMSCFFDSPHGYRWMLFPDFWEWIHFLLTKAQETPFDWYVKPHPGGLPQNDEIFEKLKAMYPKINFLGRNSPNTQLVAEGISAMFTVYGTAAHEFAFMGVPVVNAGDNPHIDFGFNIHPTTIEEYEGYIRNADKLNLKIDRSEVEEFAYMRAIWEYRDNDFGAVCVEEEFAYGKLGEAANDSKVFDGYIRAESADKDARLEKYFDQFFEPYFGKKLERPIPISWKIKGPPAKSPAPENSARKPDRLPQSEAAKDNLA